MGSGGRFEMSTSDEIRSLAREGLSVSEIARKLDIRYQHAYGVLKADGALPKSRSYNRTMSNNSSQRAPATQKPSLSVQELIKGGFELSGRWVLSAAKKLTLDGSLPNDPGVYAFAKDGIVLYVGVATMGLAKRLYFYGMPGPSQRTNQRLNGQMKRELLNAPYLEIYTAVPPDLEWNGLPVHGSAGLELGLIKKYALPWNMRSAG